MAFAVAADVVVAAESHLLRRSLDDDIRGDTSPTSLSKVPAKNRALLLSCKLLAAFSVLVRVV